MLYLFTFASLFFAKYYPHFGIYLHNACLKRSPIRFSEIYQGIVCGHNIKSPDIVGAFASTGLLHLLVVSGSHLLFLYKLGRWCRLPHGFLLFFCYVYCHLCLLEPPVVRAYVFLVLAFLNTTHRWQWSTWHQHFLSIFILLLLFPDWYRSFSFQLSILCAFALSFSFIRTEICIYFVLLPALLALGNYHPFSILFNIFLGPLLGAILFPISILVFILPPLHFFVDPIWKYLLWFLQNFSSHLLLKPSLQPSYSPEIFWFYIFIIWILGFNFKYAITKPASSFISTKPQP